MHIFVCLKVDPLPLQYHCYSFVSLFFLVDLERKYVQGNGSRVGKVRLFNKLPYMRSSVGIIPQRLLLVERENVVTSLLRFIKASKRSERAFGRFDEYSKCFHEILFKTYLHVRVQSRGQVFDSESADAGLRRLP